MFERGQLVHYYLFSYFIFQIPPDKVKTAPDPNRPLPQDRSNPQQPEFGFTEPKIVQKGKVTLRQALKFISDHQADPKTWTIDKIADEYLINKESIGKIKIKNLLNK